ncbi:uracil-DNA glycosylase [Roseateles sp. BYS87W]|uniref:Uracil-DNA glycosylase n=1 Tax=Pelomonas baiyunensis TaxID=3299026 RepID=A0ABW7H0G3_9BURK
MSWDARQRAMLAEMGYRLPPAAQEGDTAVLDDVTDAAAATALHDAAPAHRSAPAVERPRPAAPAPAPAPRAPAVASAAPRDERADLPTDVSAAASARPAVSAASAVAGLVPATRTDLAGLDWPALEQAVAGCRACGLCEQRRQPVFGAGAVDAVRWLVVTDPPDEADDGAGQPLVGDAGRLLDRMLAAAGQRRVPGAQGEAPTAFVTPVVKCRPPRGRAPQPAELAACEAVLAQQVALLRPTLVLALGLQAARRLTGLNEPLGRLRGQVHRWHGLPVVVSFPPAYLLRAPADKAGAWDDLRLALQTVAGR